MNKASYALTEMTLHVHLRQPAAEHRRVLERIMGIPCKHRNEGDSPALIVLTFRTGEAGAEGKRLAVSSYLRQHGIYHKATVEKVYDPPPGRVSVTPALLYDLVARRLERNVILKSVVEGDRVGLFADIPNFADVPLLRRHNDELLDVERAYQALLHYLADTHHVELATAKDSTGAERNIGLWVRCLRRKSRKNAS